MEYEDRLPIVTPEGVQLTLTLAGPASRFVSALVDLTIQLLLLIALAVVLGISGHAGLGGGGVAILIWSVLSFLVVTTYDIFFEVLNGGRTPGKRLNGLRVVNVEGYPVRFLTSAIRNVLRPLDFLPSAYLLGAAVILATRKNQRIGDVVAGTLVVRDRLPAWTPAAPLPVRAPDAFRPHSTWDTTNITPAELATVRQFLERRHALEPGARTRLSRELAERLRPKIAGAPANLYGESFLEALVAAKGSRS